MKRKYQEYDHLDLVKLAREVRHQWEKHGIFEKSLEKTRNGQPFVFYEGPPSANGMPGIHHVMARALKDLFCRYKTLKGFYVARKAGWDTHGLPVEINVEKTLGITKEDIGKTISVAEYNQVCRKEVMRYKDAWDDLTRKIGFWVDLEHPYITFDNKYIETVWYLLSELYKKGLLYKGYSIQPYSPAAGTGLSSHELNQPGAYRDVKDLTVVAQFRVIRNAKSEFLFSDDFGDVFFLAWTTTAWTLPSNTALAIGRHIDYVKVQTYNAYTGLPITVILGKDLLPKYFPEKNAELDMDGYQLGQKAIPFRVTGEFRGSDLEGIRYEQLLPYARPEDGDAFVVVAGDFVSTEEGTGIVHIAPSFGADDFRTGRQYGLGSLTLVDKQGRFTEAMGEFAGRFVKAEYEPDHEQNKRDSVDVDIIVRLKQENKAFRTEKYEHSYPHCWRTDKPILYYPLDSWFIRTTAFKDKLIAHNRTIDWKPASTGTGRFENWLENLVDWNLSRSRFWGVPLPVWTSEDGKEQMAVGSVAELKREIEKSVTAGFMQSNPYETYIPEDYSEENYHRIDLHRPYVDEVVLVSPSGRKMYREPDLIDVWFDSGAMPYAQLHYPFENREEFHRNFPADFIAEGVDQTRGWFYTLHAIAVMLFDSVSFKTVVSNGLVLDKEGRKMSKKLKNAADPFKTIDKYGPDATRWYMITNSQPWDNLKFDAEGIGEVQRKFFGTLYNTYAFFALYANIDGFKYAEPDIEYGRRPEIDRWILSELNTLIMNVDAFYEDYEPTKAGRAIQDFVDEHLSNWYVRLSRRRFWKGEYSNDKISAYQTLYTCLETIAALAAPIAPFFMDKLYADLNAVTARNSAESVHLTCFPAANPGLVDKDLEERMELAQKVSSLVLSLRKKSNLRVRQPLNKILVPVLDQHFERQIGAVKNLILAEVNVKELECLYDTSDLLVKKIKANFKTLGPKYGKLMKGIAAAIGGLSKEEIRMLEQQSPLTINIEGQEVVINPEDVEITAEDIPGWLVASQDNLTVALDITLTPQLIEEGIARELVNRIQNLRKDKGFEVTDKITLKIIRQPEIISAIQNNNVYICSETLAQSLDMVEKSEAGDFVAVDLGDALTTGIAIERVTDHPVA